MNNITVQNWKNYCKYIVNLEKEYWDKNGINKELCDPLPFVFLLILKWKWKQILNVLLLNNYLRVDKEWKI